MDDCRFDVVGVGNAIVDVIANVEDEFIDTHSLSRGTMTLIDAERATSLYAAMPPGIETSGGSAANTVAGVASFGGRAAYVGKVRDDQLGEVFVHDIRAAGVAFDVARAATGPSTARCLIQVTPDAERTMNTYLGISALLEPEDVDPDVIASSRIVYCEGYLWDVEVAKAAIRRAMDIGADHGRLVSLTLSDPFCVDRHREDWLDVISDRVDVLFANRAEILSLYETDSLEEAVREVRRHVRMACLTLSEQGSMIIAGDRTIMVDPVPTNLVDTTGAGDLYAAGFLFGLAGGNDPEVCGRLASAAASEVISHLGARPMAPLRRLLADVAPSAR